MSLVPRSPGPGALRVLASRTYYAIRRAGEPGFQLGGRRYRYHAHPYNMTWRNERTVEVALGLAFLRAATGETVLEVGNVLGHYVRVTHDVIDKYERAPGVLNEDIAHFRPERRYGAIVSISTLEHVGWDETPREPDKVRAAIDNLLHHCLAPGGRLLVTMPLGYNPSLDQLIEAHALPLDVRYMQRISASNRWREVGLQAVRGARFGHPFPFVNALVIATTGAGPAQRTSNIF